MVSTSPFTVTRPSAIQTSASRREAKAHARHHLGDALAFKGGGFRLRLAQHAARLFHARRTLLEIGPVETAFATLSARRRCAFTARRTFAEALVARGLVAKRLPPGLPANVRPAGLSPKVRCLAGLSPEDLPANLPGALPLGASPASIRPRPGAPPGFRGPPFPAPPGLRGPRFF